MMRVTALVLVACAAACPGRDPFTPDPDAGAREDAGVVVFEDAGPDAGEPADDAGPPDAGLDDAGPADAGLADAGPPREFGLEEREENTTCRFDAPVPITIPTLDVVDAYPALTLVDAVAIVPDRDLRLLAVERAGRVRAFSADGNGSDVTTILDLTADVDALLGAVPDPGVPGVLYTATIPTGELRVVVSRFEGGTSVGLIDVPLLGGGQARAGGSLRFGHDGMLYIALGDGGADDARDLTSLRGKILRLDVGGAPPAAIPADNPFVDDNVLDPAVRAEIFARGLGAPSCSFDRITGRLWCTDRGELVADELGFARAGADLGWPRMEASTCIDPPAGCQDGSLTLPLLPLPRATTCEVVGGVVARDANLPELQGAVLAADRCSGVVRGIRFDGRTVRANGVVTTVTGGVVAFGETASGTILIVNAAGEVLQLVRPAGSPPPLFPVTLTQTGCYADVPSRTVAPGVIPFEVRAPLWSDGAQKVRYFALQGTTTIGFRDVGSWSFPDGAVLLKEFNHPTSGRAMEVRFLVKRGPQLWDGYSFMWDREGSEAWLLDGSELVPWGASIDDDTGGAGHLHSFPDRADCLLCHNEPAGRVLGPQTGRMNTDHDYGGFVDNQLRSLDHVGLFTAPLPAPADALPRWPNLDTEGASDEEKSRAWIAGNCSHCHQPQAPSGVQIDLRFETAFAATLTCGRVPERGDLGVAGALIIKPGLPDESELFLRMSRRGNQQMPPLATLVLEEPAIATTRAWIESLVACP